MDGVGIVFLDTSIAGWFRFVAAQIINGTIGMSCLIYYFTLTKFRDVFHAYIGHYSQNREDEDDHNVNGNTNG